MLTDEQRRFYDTFGFLFLRGLLTHEEIDGLRTTFDETMRSVRGGAGPDGQGQSAVEIVETTPGLSWLLEDQRIHGTVADRLGTDYIWGGSEGNVTNHGEHRWHADRHGSSETEYHRMKVMIYLDETRADHGCLRVLPGSHRDPYHSQLGPLIEQTPEVCQKHFGMSGDELPAVMVEATPGDVLFFCHTLWHGVYNSFPGRRYIALKYAARPTTPAHIESLDRYSNGVVFQPPAVLQQSDSPILRGMVEGLAEMAP